MITSDDYQNAYMNSKTDDLIKTTQNFVVTNWRGEHIEVSAAATQHLMNRLDAAWGYIRELETRLGIPHVENLIDRE